MSTLLDLTERNANHIPSYCHLPVICRSLVDRCGSFGSCKPQISFKPAGKRPLGRPRRTREENIRMDLTLKKSVSIRGIVLIQLRMEIIGESSGFHKPCSELGPSVLTQF